MNTSEQQQAVKELLTEFDSEVDRLTKKFHSILKNYEAKKIEHLKKLISEIKQF
jgi:hypothetical protein